jgi:hypothetical protein
MISDKPLPFVYVKTCPKLLNARGRANDQSINLLIDYAKAAAQGMEERFRLPLGVVITDTVARAQASATRMIRPSAQA